MASKAARRGLKAEERLISAINSKEELGKKLINSIEGFLGVELVSCSSEKQPPRIKSDIVVSCNRRSILISVKEFEPKADYNHVERNYVEYYAKKWSIPREVYLGLKQFAGEVDKNGNPILIDAIEKEAEQLNTFPGKLSKRRRIFINELPKETQNAIRQFFKFNKEKIIKDILIGEEDIQFFIIIKQEDFRASYYVVPTREVLDVFSTGDVEITQRGSLQVGNVIMQRKSGNHHTSSGWTDRSASQLQFKIKPSQCIKNRNPVMSEDLG